MIIAFEFVQGQVEKMRRVNKFGRLMLLLLIVAALVATSPRPVIAGNIGAVVDLVLLPPLQTFNPGSTFDLTIQAQCNGQDVVGIDAYLNFDPAKIEVQSITPGTTLDILLKNTFDNSAGTIDYSAGKLGTPFPSSTFTVATVAFRTKSVAVSTATNVTFNTSVDVNAPRRTEVTSGTASVLRNAIGATVNILTPFAVTRNVPTYVGKGQTFDVTINFSAPLNDLNAIGLSDFAPAGWIMQVDKISWCDPDADESNVVNNNAQYVWFGGAGVYPKGQAFIATYKVTVPADAAPGLYNFTNGTLQYYIGNSDLYTLNITGKSQVEVVEGARIQGETWEAKGTILGGVTLTLDGDTTVVSDASGVYQLTALTTGTHSIVASKMGFRNQTRTINVTSLGDVYTLKFKGTYGLVPNAPNLTYVLACINLWKIPPADPERALNLTKVLAAINGWKFPRVMTLSPTSGAAGTVINISGINFAASTAGAVWFDSNGNGIKDTGEPQVAMTTTDTGAFPAGVTLTVPSVDATTYQVCADIPAGDTTEASANFTVTP